MGEEKVCNIFPKDYAARLLLTEKVLGLEEAEKFFKSIPENMRDFTVYSTLLTSYTRSEETLDKSESTFKKMRELGFLLKPSPYNSMISLYSQLGKQDMVDKLLNEMEENNVHPDNVAVNNVLKFYADVSDVKAMEMFMKMWVNEEGEGIKLEQGTIVAMAKAYVRVGSVRKAIEMYGDVAGSAREVHSLWKECKKTGKVNGEGYRTVISALLKLNDVEGAEKIYGEWKEKEHELDIIKEGLLIAQGKELKVIREQVNQLVTKNPSTELVNLLIAQGNGLNENRELLAKRLTQLIDLIPVLVPLGILYYFPLYLGVPLALFSAMILNVKSIPLNMRDYSVYSTLLTSYTRSEETLDKAESTFKKMRELGFLLKASPYNSMISLYNQLGDRNMVDKLLYEMEEKNVKPDMVTANNVLRLYAGLTDVKSMEKFMRMWVNEKEEGIQIQLEKGTIVEMAKAYVRVGSLRKAIEMYGDVAGSGREVHSLWNECKKKGKVKEEGYRTVISALLKLNDFEGAENIYGEWREKGHELRVKVMELVTKKPMMKLEVFVSLLMASSALCFHFLPYLCAPLAVLGFMLFVTS